MRVVVLPAERHRVTQRIQPGASLALLDREIGVDEQGHELEQVIVDIACQRVNLAQLHLTVTVVTAFVEHLAQSQPAQNLDEGNAHLEGEIEGFLLFVVGADRILLEEVMPGAEVVEQAHIQAARPVRGRFHALEPCGGLLQVSRPELSTGRIGQQLVAPYAHAVGVVKRQALLHRLHALRRLSQQHVVHRLHDLERREGDRRQVRFTGQRSGALYRRVSLRILTGPHERECEQGFYCASQGGVRGRCGNARGALGPDLYVGVIGLAQHHGHEHAARHPRFYILGEGAWVILEQLVEDHYPAVQQG